MPESSETPAQRARQVVTRYEFSYSNEPTHLEVALARDVIALEAVARRLLDGWEPRVAVWVQRDLPYDIAPEEARILDLLRDQNRA